LPGHDSEIEATFKMLDGRLAELLRAGDTIQFGVHYGRQVEFEYEVGMDSGRDSEVLQRSLEPPATGMRRYSLLSVAALTKVDGGIRGTLKVSKDQYEAWKAEVLASSDLRASAGSSSP
jgi:hypothetical protein